MNDERLKLLGGLFQTIGFPAVVALYVLYVLTGDLRSVRDELRVNSVILGEVRDVLRDGEQRRRTELSPVR